MQFSVFYIQQVNWAYKKHEKTVFIVILSLRFKITFYLFPFKK
jgi:hypothetical protein